MTSNEFALRSKNWRQALEACVQDIEKVSTFMFEFSSKKKDGTVSQGDVDELFNSKQIQGYFKDLVEVMRIVYRVEISFDTTKDFVPDVEAAAMAQLIEKAKTLQDQIEAYLKALNLSVSRPPLPPFPSLSDHS